YMPPAPVYLALKASIGQIGTYGFGDWLTVQGSDISLEVNTGTPWPGGFGPPVIDFSSTPAFAAEAGDEDRDGDGKFGEPVGFEVNTGSDSVYLDFPGFDLISLTIGNAKVSILDFVYLEGSFAFEKGPIQTFTVETGLTTMPLEMETMTIGASDVSGFVGINGPYLTDTNDDGDLDDETPNDAAVGLTIADLDFGMAIMTPTILSGSLLELAVPKFYTVVGECDTAGLVGTGNDLTGTAYDLGLALNSSSLVLPGSIKPAYIDYQATFETSAGAHDGVYEIPTGAEPIVVDFDSILIQVEGQVELNLGGSVYLAGSAAFVRGPTQDVILSDAARTTTSVSTMTIGVANATAFVGANGPYWTDADGDHAVDSDELNSNSVGFHITDLDMGIMVMSSLSLSNAGVYLAAKASVDSFGTVGMDILEVAGQFDIAMNLGLGTAGLAAVDFAASFNEQMDLFDTNSNEIITVGELRTLAGQGSSGAYADLYETTDADTVEVDIDDIVYVLDTAGNGDGVLQVGEAQVFLSNDSLAEAADANGNGQLNFGFEVNTGNPASPVLLDFLQPLISFQLAGSVTIYTDTSQATPVFRLNGMLLFEVNTTGLTAFVVAGLEFGPDIGASGDKLFDMNALGGLVINADGIAADIDVSLSVGGALSSILTLDASARLVFNTTGVDQTITIPKRYVDFLDGTAALETSFIGPDLQNMAVDTDTLGTLVGTLDSRFTVNSDDGSAAFTIHGGAPILAGGFETASPYFFVSLHGDLTIASTFTIAADFQLKISGAGLDLQINGTIDLDKFGNLNVSGGATIEAGVFAANIDLGVNVLDGIPGIEISGNFTLDIDTSTDTYRVAIDATVDLFDVFTATGDLAIGVQEGVLSIVVENLSISFFGIVDFGISGYIRSDGSFSLSGGLNLNLTVGSGASEFGINGSVGVTIKNAGVSGQGSVGLVILGQNINVASAELSVDWQAGTFEISAEGPLGVWVKVTGPGETAKGWDIDGGIGSFADVLNAIGDVAEEVGQAIADAAQAVAGAIDDLGDAILDFGEDVLDFASGLISDIGGFLNEIGGALSDAFSSTQKKSHVHTFSVDPASEYSYTTSLSGADNEILTITNDDASKICLAIVNGKLIVDAPDVTKSIKIAERVYEERHKHWKVFWPHWHSWHTTSTKKYYENITFSNMKKFTASDISKIIIKGTDSSETIILDRKSVSIDTTVYGNGGNDTIATGKGNDTVYGGDGHDTIFTYEGDDTLYGQDDNDKLFGGTGNDTLYGGDGDDLLNENYGRAHPNQTITETNTLIGGAGDDNIQGLQEEIP
ncbi:MAG: hypothetical protein HQ515_23060, partial [Phycisphaeraceae bacterium]|nr:hypothetical protein [Phycisphaeraceae bacterium]